MRTCEQLIRALQEGAYDDSFKTLYAPDGNEATMLRAKGLPESPIENLTLENVKSNNQQVSVQDIGTMIIK